MTVHHSPRFDLPVLQEPRLRSGADLLALGAAMARDWQVGSSPFLTANGVACEAQYKQRESAAGRIMQHAHIGFRSIERTLEAVAAIHGRCSEAGVRVDRFGITLDWSMGYPQDRRAGRPCGTGIVLDSVADFARITHAAPAAAHFGDFMLGLPAAVENTRAALAAGCTSVGNLGQYFTFRLPDWDDDIATTEATVIALGLIAAQPVPVLVHSNLDDGFAALFSDMCSSIGMVLIEKHIIEDLIGAQVSHCYGHHFSEPVTRHAFHNALRQVTSTPGTMIFGNTVSYRSAPAGNYASLSSYLMTDILGVRRYATGHAINPVPVTENVRIPDTDEIIAAQTFAHRLVDHAAGYETIVDWSTADRIAATLVDGGRAFARNVLQGLADRGVDTRDAAAIMLAIRRLGAKRLEALFGIGDPGAGTGPVRTPRVAASWMDELDAMAEAWLLRNKAALAAIPARNLTVCIGTTDVHEHGKHLIESIFSRIGIGIVDAGVSIDADDLVATAIDARADFIAVSTYNGVALRFAQAVRHELAIRGEDLPLVFGGRLNQIPDNSNTSLPVDVTDELVAIGVEPCSDLDQLPAVLLALVSRRAARPRADVSPETLRKTAGTEAV